MYEMYAFSTYKHGGNGLYNQAEKLWWRDKDFVPPSKEPNGGNWYWSRGNGGVVAAVVRTLQMLPKSDPHYNEYLQDYKDMLKALLPLQRTDGFWNVFFFKQKTAYDIGLGIPAEPLFRSWRRLRTRRPKLGSTLPVGSVRIKCTAWK